MNLREINVFHLFNRQRFGATSVPCVWVGAMGLMIVLQLGVSSGWAQDVGGGKETLDRPGHYPEPNVYNHDWEFGFSYDKPQLISARDLDGKIRWYWYMTYTVTNDTGQERVFLPDFTIATDTGDIVTADRNIPAGVFDVISQRKKNPALESSIQITGPLLQGEDHARDGVAVWRVFDDVVDEMTIFVAGLSGEIHIVPHPTTGEDVYMARTLMITVHVPGDPVRVQDRGVVGVGDVWVVR